MCRLLSLLVCLSILPSASAAQSATYLYGGTSPIYQNNIERTRGNINTVYADYFYINSNGDAALNKIPDTLFIQTMRNKGICVAAFVSNHWDDAAARKALAKRATVAETLAGWVDKYGLDGLDIDIENLNQNDRDAFTDFVRLTRQALPANKSLSVAVAANPYRFTTGWRGMYDYAALGQLCDSMLLMTYDQSYEGGPAGPVASYKFIEDSIKEALRFVPREKLYMGIPFYGRYWAALGNGITVNGKAFTVADIETITGQYGAKTWYDSTNQCARAAVTVAKDDPALNLWGGKKLEPGVYDIWYDDERSYSEKLKLCAAYGLAGAGSWALGQEPEHIWIGYRLWLSGIPFTDLAGHWAEQPICELYEQGYVTGAGNNLVIPEKPVTRAEAIVLLCRILGVQPVGTSGAPDEIKHHWASEILWSAVKTGLLRGDGISYRPDGAITRAELATLCYQAMHVPNTIDFNQIHFPDVRPGDWFNNAVVTMKVYSLVSGFPDGFFHPYDGATRAELFTLMWKLLSVELKSFTKSSPARSSVPAPHTTPPVLEPR